MFSTVGTKKTSEILYRYTASCNIIPSMYKVIFPTKLYFGMKFKYLKHVYIHVYGSDSSKILN